MAVYVDDLLIAGPSKAEMRFEESEGATSRCLGDDNDCNNHLIIQ